MVHGESARSPPMARQLSPVNRYHAPAAIIGRGKKRHDEKIPRLKMTCQIPGSIHVANGAYRRRTMVTSRPAAAEGRNCSTAIRSISLDNPEWMRRARLYICTPVKAADNTAVETQTTRYAEM